MCWWLVCSPSFARFIWLIFLFCASLSKTLNLSFFITTNIIINWNPFHGPITRFLIIYMHISFMDVMYLSSSFILFGNNLNFRFCVLLIKFKQTKWFSLGLRIINALHVNFCIYFLHRSTKQCTHFLTWVTHKLVTYTWHLNNIFIRNCYFVTYIYILYVYGFGHAPDIAWNDCIGFKWNDLSSL